MSGARSHLMPSSLLGEGYSPDCLRPRRVVAGPGDGAMGEADQNLVRSPAPGFWGRSGGRGNSGFHLFYLCSFVQG